MKIIKNPMKDYAAIIKLSGFFLLTFFLACCTMQNENPVPVTDEVIMESSNAEAKKINIQGGITNFEGFVQFKLYKVKEHDAIFDVAFPVAGASLEHVNDHNYILNVDDGMRDIAYITTMTPSGSLECIFPIPSVEVDPVDGTVFDNPVDQLEYTTGFGLRGPGINKKTLIYKGKFDGENLFVSTHFMGLQEKFGTYPFYQEVIEGPVQFTFAFDLTVVDD